ncbi:hypothetical protein C0989_009566 [Termitomyces sp. Mn162]|nr:hypothetical protein C0989_009566 [Termitomyces sp. Mn162]
MHRLWLVLVALLGVLALAHYALPSSPPPATPRFSSAHLRPKNYFNASDASPFSFCPVYGPGDPLVPTYGAQALSKILMHPGSGERIQRVVNSALAAHPASTACAFIPRAHPPTVSACHGAGDDPVAPACYPARFFEWWNSVFPHPATELTNGAMRRTNSGYFGYCSAHHIPDLTDLVIIELDGDDTTDPDMLDNFETLVRSILIRPDHPAVLLLGHFNPQTHQIYGFAGPDHTHDIVAQFYDVPHITSKPLLYPSYIRDSSSISKYFVDPVLASPKGHQVLADVLIEYFQAQICQAWAVTTGASYSPSSSSSLLTSPSSPHLDAHALFGGVGQRKGVPEPGAKDTELDLDGNRKPPGALALALPQNDREHQRPPHAPAPVTPVPPGRINTRPGAGPFEEIAPFCVSANDLIPPLPPSMFYGSGWNVFHSPPVEEGGGPATTSHYWYSTLPGSKLRVPIQVGAGDVGVYYVREPVAKVGAGSRAKCWVDDNVPGARVIDNVLQEGEEETPTLVVIDHFVSRGSHFVECVLEGEEGEGVPMFRIVGIFAT